MRIQPNQLNLSGVGQKVILQAFVDNGSSPQQPNRYEYTKINFPVSLSTIYDPYSLWDATNYVVSVPQNDFYLCFARVRFQDSGTGHSFGLAIHTSAVDGAWVDWAQSGVGSGGGYGVQNTRMGAKYQRFARFNSGDTLQMYTYLDCGYFQDQYKIAQAEFTVIQNTLA